MAGIYDPLPTPTTVGSRGVTKVAFQNLFREISGLRKRGEKKKEEEEGGEEGKKKKKSRALAFDRALDRNAERSSLRAGSERPSPNCRQRDTMPPFSVFLSFDRATVNGAWMSWMSCLAAETPDVLNATSNIDGALDRTRDLCFRFQVARSLARSHARLLAFVRTY